MFCRNGRNPSCLALALGTEIISLSRPAQDGNLPLPTGAVGHQSDGQDCALFLNTFPGRDDPTGNLVAVAERTNTEYVTLKRTGTGNGNTSVYFECHYFGVSLIRPSGLPLLAA